MAEAYEKLRDKIISSVKTSSDPLATIASEINSYLNSNTKAEFSWVGANTGGPDPTESGEVSLMGSAVVLNKALVTASAFIPPDPTPASINSITTALKTTITSAIKVGIGTLALVPSAEWQIAPNVLSTSTNYATTSFISVYFKKVDVTGDSDFDEVQKEVIGELCKNLINKVESLKGVVVSGTHGAYTGAGAVTNITIS